MSRGSFWLIATVFFVATSVTHLWMIGSVPPGLYNDESSNAYNAYCILETGADEYGVSYPIFFRCMEDYRDPVLIYSIVPAIKLFGLTKVAARLPSALYFIGASIAFVLLSYEYCHDKWVALAGGVLFSFTPWTFNFSRIAIIGYTPMLLGMILGWWLLMVAVRKSSWRLAVLAGVAWAFAMYAYYVGRPIVALLTVCFLASFAAVVRSRWRVVAVFLGSLVLSTFPMMIGTWRNPHVLTARFQRISIFHQGSDGPQALLAMARRYVEYFDPGFLFWSGDQNLRHGTGASGVLFLFLAPLVVVGLYSTIRHWPSSPHHRFLLLGVLTYPAAAMLTIDHMHSGRSVNGVIFLVLAAVLGIHQLLVPRKLTGQVATALLSLFGVVEIAWFCRDYFGPYQTRARPWFEAELTEAIEYCFEHTGTDETLYISRSVFDLQLHKDDSLELLVDSNFHYYPAVLFFGRISPSIYQRQGIPKDRVQLYDGAAPRPGLLLRRNLLVMQETGFAKYWLSRNTEPLPPRASLVKTLPCPSPGRYEIYRVP
jgi:4-amino-4-deoxy-L-arabinose transferase-like glycosyltransferase